MYCRGDPCGHCFASLQGAGKPPANTSQTGRIRSLTTDMDDFFTVASLVVCSGNGYGLYATTSQGRQGGGGEDLDGMYVVVPVAGMLCSVVYIAFCLLQPFAVMGFSVPVGCGNLPDLPVLVEMLRRSRGGGRWVWIVADIGRLDTAGDHATYVGASFTRGDLFIWL